MITDELLERGLGMLSEEYDVPPRAIDDLLDQLSPAPLPAPLDDEQVTRFRRHWPPSPRTWLMSSAAAVVVLVIVAFAVGGGSPSSVRSDTSGAAVAPTSETTDGRALFGGKAASGGGPVAAPVPGRAALTSPQTDADTSAAGARNTSSANTTPAIPDDSLTKIVQTGQLDLQVDKGKVHDTIDALASKAARMGGLVANSQTTDGDAPSGTITLRVPNGSFATLLSQARSLGKPLSEDTKTANVTGQYTDVQARLHALGLTKTTYLNILAKASTIGEILSVQQRVNDVQTQIDQLQGQLNVLNNETSLATLTVNIDQKAKVTPASVVHHQSGLGKAVHRSVSRFVHGVEAIIGVIGPIVLILVLLLLGWLATKVGYRIVRRQMV